MNPLNDQNDVIKAKKAKVWTTTTTTWTYTNPWPSHFVPGKILWFAFRSRSPSCLLSRCPTGRLLLLPGLDDRPPPEDSTLSCRPLPIQNSRNGDHPKNVQMHPRYCKMLRYPFFASTFLHLNAVFFNHFLTPTFIYSDFSTPTQLSLHIFSHLLKPTLFLSHFSSQTDFRRHHLFSGRSQGTLSTQRTSKICLA